MLFRQLLHEPLAAASYVLGCPESGQAVVIDPCLPATDYALLAADHGLRIVAVLETHMHADYISSGRALAALTGAALCIPRMAEACFAHMPVDDGWEFAAGNVLLQALHTPGHTPEHTAYLVTDQGRSQQPWFVLSGDCLFVGDVGRADLVDLPQSGAEYLFHSLRRLLDLPETVELFPTHYGGSACGGKGMSNKPSSTIGFERRENPFAHAFDLEAFRTMLDATAREAVDSVLLNRNTNRGALALPADYGGWPAELGAIAGLSLTEALREQQTGAAIIDLRDRLQFAAAHVPGALSSVYHRAALAGRIAALTEADQPLVLLADWPFLANYAAMLLAKSGRNPVVGFVTTAADTGTAVELAQSVIPLYTVADLHQATTAGTVLILDVRAAHEQAQGVIAGARTIPFDAVRTQIGTLPRHRPIVVVCESGIRAVGIASLLQAQGFHDVAAVAPNGMSEYWRYVAKEARTENQEFRTV